MLLGLVADLEIETKPFELNFFKIYIASSCFKETYTLVLVLFGGGVKGNDHDCDLHHRPFGEMMF